MTRSDTDATRISQPRTSWMYEDHLAAEGIEPFWERKERRNRALFAKGFVTVFTAKIAGALMEARDSE